MNQSSFTTIHLATSFTACSTTPTDKLAAIGFHGFLSLRAVAALLFFCPQCPLISSAPLIVTEQQLHPDFISRPSFTSLSPSFSSILSHHFLFIIYLLSVFFLVV